MENLLKCEQVLVNLYAKVEQVSDLNIILFTYLLKYIIYLSQNGNVKISFIFSEIHYQVPKKRQIPAFQ